MISEKRNTEYSQTVNWIRCKLSFALLRASIISIRGARSSRQHAVSEATQGPIDLHFKINFCFHWIILLIFI